MSRADKFTWKGGDVVAGQCMYCARFGMGPGRTGGCAAFPAGIPLAILGNKADHRRPYLDPESGLPADTGVTGERSITFTPAADASPAALAALYHDLDALTD